MAGDAVSTPTESEIERLLKPPMGVEPYPRMVTYSTEDGQKRGFWPLFDVDPSWIDILYLPYWGA